MAHRFLLLLTIPLAIILVGCGKPKIDGSTDQKMRELLEKVRAALPESSRSEFDGSLKIIAFADMNGFGDLIALAQAGGLDQSTKSRIAVKNALEIIAECQRIKAERIERQRQEAISEMKALRTKLENEAPADRDDTVLIVRPVRLDGVDGKSLTGEQFSEEDIRRADLAVIRSLI